MILWIKLRRAENGKPTWIQPQHIVSMEADESMLASSKRGDIRKVKCTNIWFVGETKERPLQVLESIVQIEALTLKSESTEKERVDEFYSQEPKTLC